MFQSRACKYISEEALLLTVSCSVTRKEGNVLFNDALNTFYLRLYGVRHMVKDHYEDIWLRTIMIVRNETSCRHIGYSFRLTARVLLYAPSHRQDSTYHSLCYTSRDAVLQSHLIGQCFVKSFTKVLVGTILFWEYCLQEILNFIYIYIYIYIYIDTIIYSCSL